MKITILPKQQKELIPGIWHDAYFMKITLPELGYSEYDKWNRYSADIFVKDQYYYPDLPPMLRIIRNVQKILAYWLVQLEGLSLEAVCYLPLHFSFDEYDGFEVGGFSIRHNDADFLIAHRNYTNIFRGTSPLYPSDYLEGRVHMTEGNFREDPVEYVLIKTDFVKHVQATIEDLEQQYVAMLL